MRELQKPHVWSKIARTVASLAQGLRADSVRVPHVGGLLSISFSDSPVETFSHFFHGMLERGVYLPLSPFEAWFVGAAHAQEDIELTIEVVGPSPQALCASRP